MKKLVSILLCVTMLCAVLVVPTTDNSIDTTGLITKEDVYEGLEE